MIDKSLPYFPLTLVKTDTEKYPRRELPLGFHFAFYKAGDEVHWAEIERSLGQFETVEEGVACFHREFPEDYPLRPEDRMLFVIDDEGEYVATVALWDGDFLGERRQRMHWLAVKDKVSGRGIAAAMTCRVLDLYRELGYRGFIYLLTATWYYPAILIYRKFGYVEYRGEVSLVAGMPDAEFREKNEDAIASVDAKLAEFCRK